MAWAVTIIQKELCIFKKKYVKAKNKNKSENTVAQPTQDSKSKAQPKVKNTTANPKQESNQLMSEHVKKTTVKKKKNNQCTKAKTVKKQQHHPTQHYPNPK